MLGAITITRILFQSWGVIAEKRDSYRSRSINQSKIPLAWLTSGVESPSLPPSKGDIPSHRYIYERDLASLRPAKVSAERNCGVAPSVQNISEPAPPPFPEPYPAAAPNHTRAWANLWLSVGKKNAEGFPSKSKPAKALHIPLKIITPTKGNSPSTWKRLLTPV